MILFKLITKRHIFRSPIITFKIRNKKGHKGERLTAYFPKTSVAVICVYIYACMYTYVWMYVRTYLPMCIYACIPITNVSGKVTII